MLAEMLPELEMHRQTMRSDLQQSLSKSHIRPSDLSTFQRILLTTDGTVTHILEAYLYEQIQVVKLSEQLVALKHPIPSLDLQTGTEVIARKILLQGRISRRNFIYAESLLIPDRLEERFRREILDTQTPIGKIWFSQRVETFKEIVDSGRESAHGLSTYFGLEADEGFLFRTYRVHNNGQCAMVITEKFPESFFLENF